VGTRLCQTQAFVSPQIPALFPGGSQGLFFSNSNVITRFDQNCLSTDVFTSDRVFAVPWAYVSDVVISIDYSLLSSGDIDPGTARLFAISPSGQLLWRSTRIQPNANPVLATDSRSVYVRGIDLADSQQKVFAVDAVTGELISAIPYDPYCTNGCSVSARNDSVYIAPQGEPRIYKFQLVSP
jgi:hypothetical protein